MSIQCPTTNDHAPLRQHQPFPYLDGVQWFVCVNPESKLGCLRNLGTPSVTNRNGAFGIIFSGTKASVSSRLHVKHWIFKQMLSPKTMWPACCGMAVDASCWSINMVWSPISKLSRATCQPSVDVPVAYHSLAQRHILLLPNEFCCCPSGMCLLHMFSIEVLGTSRRKLGMGLRNTLVQGSDSLISEASGFDYQIFLTNKKSIVSEFKVPPRMTMCRRHSISHSQL